MRRISAQILADHLRRNPISVAHRHTGVRRALAFVGRHKLAVGASAVALYGVVLALTAMCPPTAFGPQAPEGLDDYFRDLQTINLALMGAQSTLVGLVYPLVIALVGLLFQESASRTGRLTVYFRETEAAVVGALSLVFIAVLGVQSLSYALVPLKVTGAMTVLNVLWFIANLAGLAFFVLRSLDFVRPARRRRMLESYVANEAWRNQLAQIVLLNRWMAADRYGYLSTPPLIGGGGLIGPYDFDPPLARRLINQPKALLDVDFGCLNAIVRGQARAAVAKRPLTGLTFAARPGRAYRNEIVLLRGIGDLNWAERLLIAWAYHFGPVDRTEPAPLTDILLKEAVSDALSQFELGRFDDFRGRLDDASELHVLLYGLAQEPLKKDEASFNYALMEEGFGTLGGTWLDAYSPMLRRIAERFEGDPRFFESCAYLAPRLYRQARKVAPFKSVEVLFDIPGMLLVSMMARVAEDHADRNPGPIIPGVTFAVPGSLGQAYRRSWLSFVAGWERFGLDLADVDREGVADWATLSAIAPDIKRHLRDSALMVARAAQLGEEQAIGWTVDILLKWKGQVARPWHDRAGQAWALNRAVPTLALMDRVWEEVAALPLAVHGQIPTPASVFGAAIANAWMDTVVILLTNLLGRCPDPVGGKVEGGTPEAAAALFQNRAFDPGASAHSRGPEFDTAALLRCLVRMADRADGYQADFEELADAIDRLEGPNYVSGRVYGWSGPDIVHADADLTLILLASTLAPLAGRRRGTFAVGEELTQMLLPRLDASRRNIRWRLRGLQDAVAGVDLVRAAALMSLVTGQAIDATEAGARLERTQDVLASCQAIIDAERETRITASVVDPARLAEVEFAAGATAFSPDHFPLSLFGDVAVIDEVLPRFTYRLNGLPRGAYTDPAMDDGYAGGDDFFDQHLASNLRPRILFEALVVGPAVQKSPRTPVGWWREIKAGVAAVEAAGFTPILIRPDRRGPEWLLDWHYGAPGDTTRPADLILERREDFGDGYDFHLNGVAMYSSGGAGLATWVLGREMFERAEFETFPSGRQVQASFAPDPGDVWRATISLEWGRRLTMAQGPKWRIGPKAKAVR